VALKCGGGLAAATAFRAKHQIQGELCRTIDIWRASTRGGLGADEFEGSGIFERALSVSQGRRPDFTKWPKWTGRGIAECETKPIFNCELTWAHALLRSCGDSMVRALAPARANGIQELAMAERRRALHGAERQIV